MRTKKATQIIYIYISTVYKVINWDLEKDAFSEILSTEKDIYFFYKEYNLYLHNTPSVYIYDILDYLHLKIVSSLVYDTCESHEGIINRTGCKIKAEPFNRSMRFYCCP